MFRLAVQYLNSDGEPIVALEPGADLAGKGHGLGVPVQSSSSNPSDDSSTSNGVIIVPVFVNRSYIASRMPITGGREVVYAAIIIAMAASVLVITALERKRQG